MVDITIFELHLPEAQFNAPFAGSSGSRGSHPEDAPEPTVDEEPGTAGGGGPLGPVVVVLVLLGLALLARRLRESNRD